MKKNILYSILLLFVAGMAVLIFLKSSNKLSQTNTAVKLLERKGALANTTEWINTKKAAEQLFTKLEQNPADIKTLVRLSNLMITEARITGNYSYYDAAALKYINNALNIDSKNFEAMTLKSVVLLSQHHFADGLAVAENVRKLNPYNAYVYGLMVDGNVEMGRYDSALTAAEKMISIRPDLRSYARVSYLREIYGDYTGAIEAMKMAVDAGIDGDESTEWSRVQLGHLFEKSGDIATAKMQYTLSLNNRPQYAYALAGLGRIAAAEKKYDSALTYYQQANALINESTFSEEIADVYFSMNKKEDAIATLKSAIEEMEKNANAAAANENIGHYADRELAIAFTKLGIYDKAVQHALAEYNRRPGNIDVNETLAWAYFKSGDTDKAIQHIQKALVTGSRNPSLLCHAGIILSKSSNKETAKRLLEQALVHQFAIVADLKQESNEVLAGL